MAMNLVKIADLLKNAPDQALAQELNNPSGGVPSYMVLSELERRKKMRSSMMNQEPQTSVAEDAEQEMAAQMVSQMGLGSMPQAQAYSDTAPQEEQGYAAGGEVRGYSAGDYVDYGGGYPVGEYAPSWEDIKRWTGYGRMLPKRPEELVAPTAPQVAPRVAPTTLAAPASALRSATPATERAPKKATKAEAAPTPDYYGEQFKKLVSQQADAYQKQADILAQQAEEVKANKNSDLGLALMQAGLGIAAGRSSNAVTNIGEGAMAGLQQYVGSDRERRKELQRLAIAQGSTGIEQLGAQLKGMGVGAEYDLGRGGLDVKKRLADIEQQKVGIMANQNNTYKQAALDQRIMALREKAIEALEKNMEFQTMNPQQQEAAIQRRMQLISGQFSASPSLGGVRDYSEFMRR